MHEESSQLVGMNPNSEFSHLKNVVKRRVFLYIPILNSESEVFDIDSPFPKAMFHQLSKDHLPEKEKRLFWSTQVIRVAYKAHKERKNNVVKEIKKRFQGA